MSPHPTKHPPLGFSPHVLELLPCWRFIAIDFTSQGGAWGWVGWLPGNIQGPNAWIDRRWKYVYYLIIVNQFFRAHFFFGNCSIINKIPFFIGLNDSYIGGWLLRDVSTMDFDACICWMTNAKVFYNCSPYSQSSTFLVFQGSFSRCNISLGF
jgi:hypothetical protein